MDSQNSLLTFNDTGTGSETSGKPVQKIKYPCGCEIVGYAPMSKTCPTHGSEVLDGVTGSDISVAMVLDESSSMSSCREQTIQGYNEYLKGLREDGKRYFITLSKFDFFANDPTCRVIYEDVPVEKAELLTRETYKPRGSTPLYDAIGMTIRSMESATRPKLVIIMTDGEENSSKEYTKDSIKKLIGDKEKEGDWTFVYLGANQDAWAVGQTFGMHQGNVASYGVHNTHQVMCNLATATSTRSGLASRGLTASASYFQDAGIGDVNVHPGASALGKKGGKASADSLTEEERKLRASAAANARWSTTKK